LGALSVTMGVTIGVVTEVVTALVTGGLSIGNAPADRRILPHGRTTFTTADESAVPLSASIS
jgi:hypothetical protein